MRSERDRRDATFEALSDSRRRDCLRHLGTADPPVAISELATAVANREAERPGIADAGPDVREVEVDLRHVHLPKMHDADVLDYDDGDGSVVQTAGTMRARSHLETAPER